MLRIAIAARTGDTEGDRRPARTAASDRRRRPPAAARAQGLPRPRRGLGDGARNPQQGAAAAARPPRRPSSPRCPASPRCSPTTRCSPARAGPARSRAAGRGRAALRRAARRRLRRPRRRARAPRRQALLTVADDVRGDRRRLYAMRRRGRCGDVLRGRRAPGLGAPRGRAGRRAARADQGTQPPVIDGIDASRWRSPRARASSSASPARGSNAEIADRLVLSVRTWRPTSTGRCRSSASATAATCDRRDSQHLRELGRWSDARPSSSGSPARAGRDGCPGVIVHARAGAGKSRLAREANAAAAAEGLPAIWVQATRSASTIPLGAFAGVIPDDVRSDDTLELLRRSGEALRAGRATAVSCSASTTRSCSIRCRRRSSCTWPRARPRSWSRRSARESRCRTRSSRCGRTRARRGSSSGG